MRIRAATAADLVTLQAFAEQTWLTAFGDTFDDADEPARYVAEELSLARFAQALVTDEVLLAQGLSTDVRERLLGYVQIGPAHFEDMATKAGDQDLRRLYVTQQAQSQGIGHALLEAALALPTVRTASNVYLDVWEHNLGAQRLYRRFGFQVIAKRRYKNADGTFGDTDFQMRRVQPQ